MARKHRSKKPRRLSDGLVEITQAQFNRLARNKRCRLAGANEGGSTHICGRSLALSMGHDGSQYRYYKLTGRTALDVGYTFKRRGPSFPKYPQ